MKARFHAVMFDLDGTLADTLADIQAAANHVMQELHQPTLDAKRTGELIGHGVENLVRRALGPEHQHQVERGIELFKSYYAAHGLDFTKPYPGIEHMLDTLTAKGLKLAVLSNKIDEAVQQVIHSVFAKWKFEIAIGQRPGDVLKPDPTVALSIVKQLNVTPEQTVYVGDSEVDMQTGRNAGFYTVGVSWGFRSRQMLEEGGAQLIIDHPSQLLPLFNDIPQQA